MWSVVGGTGRPEISRGGECLYLHWQLMTSMSVAEMGGPEKYHATSHHAILHSIGTCHVTQSGHVQSVALSGDINKQIRHGWLLFGLSVRGFLLAPLPIFVSPTCASVCVGISVCALIRKCCTQAFFFENSKEGRVLQFFCWV